MDWRHDAACRDVDPELFFPIGNTGPALLQIDEAKQVCRRCPAIEACLQWALESGQDAGVWGGMSEDERRASSGGPAGSALAPTPERPSRMSATAREPGGGRSIPAHARDLRGAQRTYRGGPGR